MSNIHDRIDGLERAIENGLFALTKSIGLLTEAIAEFGKVQKEIIFRILNWLMAIFSVVILTLLGLKLSEAGILKGILGVL